MSSEHGGAKIFNLTTESFQDEVLDNAEPILIDFWAPWCGPCRMMTPILQEAASLLGDQVRIAKVNVDEEPGLAGAFSIQGIPTLVLMQNKKVLDAITGVVPASQLAQRVRSRLAS